MRTHDIRLPLLAIDPGRNVGWALAIGGELAACGTERNVEWKNVDAVDNLLARLPHACAVIAEMPRVYPSVAKWKGDPQHIVRLAMLTGRIVERFAAWAVVEPKTWQGGSPPERVVRNRTWSRLSVNEKTLIERGSMTSHAWDAIGILLYSLNRC